MKLDRLLTAKDIAERYGKSEKTAMRYMRQMEHMEKPLRVTEENCQRSNITGNKNALTGRRKVGATLKN